MNRQGLNLSTRDYEGFRHDMIEMLKTKIPEYSDFSQSDAGIVLIELLAYNLDVLSYYNEKVANELFLETAMERESIARLCRMLGYTLRDSSPSKYKQVFQITPQDKEFIIPKGYVIQTDDSLAEQSVEFETDHALVIPPRCNGLEVDENGEYLYSVPITQGFTVNNEIIGSSNGSPNQTFLLDYKPVITDSIELYVNEGRGFEKWTKVDHFINSTSMSQHYLATTLEDGVVSIKFGNGVSGKVPLMRVDNIMCSYRVGGGTLGNVGVNNITKMPQKLADIVRTFNPYEPYIWGKNAEDVEEARIKAPAQLGTKFGVVTLSDFKNLALGMEGVIRANAVKDTVLKQPIVHVYYLADKSVNIDELEQRMIDEYAEKKLVGTNVELHQAKTRPINVKVVAKTFNTNIALEVQQQIETTLQNLITVGKYDFGECPEPSDLVLDLLNLDCIRALDVEISNNEDLQADEVVTLGQIDVEIIGGR